jgi:nucleoside-diphosphate-sugar epimerase
MTLPHFRDFLPTVKTAIAPFTPQPASKMPKVICIVGVTGNQGGSVAQRFLQDPSYRIRGLTRNPASPAAVKLAEKGVEIVQADLDDINTIIPTFEGANIIFSVTNYWEPFFRPDCRQKAAAAGISCRRYAYEVEIRQGKNIADAAAKVVDGLDENGFIASTLSHAGMCSKGDFKELYHFDAKADVFPYYVKEKYAKLAAKMSCVQTGYFTSSYKLAPGAYFGKVGCCFPLQMCAQLTSHQVT